jgi:hypothetical protein
MKIRKKIKSYAISLKNYKLQFNKCKIKKEKEKKLKMDY